MSTKPSAVPTWASDATYTGGSEAGTNTKVEPASGRKAEGWEPAAKPPAQEFNWWWNLVGLWCQYLNDGALSGAHSIAGTLGVTGAADFDSTVNIDGALTLNGELKHGNRVLHIPGLMGLVINAGSSQQAPESEYIYPTAGRLGAIEAAHGAGTRDIIFSVPLKLGDRIKGVSARVKGDASADITVMDVVRVTAGVAFNIGTTSDPNSSASIHTVTPAVTPYTLVAADYIYVAFTVEDNIQIYGIEVTYDRI